MKAYIEKRLRVLEAQRVSISDHICDPNRRLARYASYFDGRPWEGTGTPERKAQREARLAGYKKYFDEQVRAYEGQS
jgi:hypothetical protein